MKHHKSDHLDGKAFQGIVKERFSENDLPLSDTQAVQFSEYHSAILRWNSRANLISKSDETRILERHFLESAALVRIEDLSGRSRCLDLGSGGGFPGLPLKLMNNIIEMTLLDSRRLKTLFLRNVARTLRLSDISVVCDRAEVACRRAEFAEAFDFVIARAVTDLKRLYRLACPFLKSQGKLIAIKGSKLDAEAHQLQETAPSVCVRIEPLPIRAKSRGAEQWVASVVKTEAWMQ